MTEIVVNTREDVVDAGDGLTSLREAVAQATHQGDVIKFDHAVLLGANSGVVYLDSTLVIGAGQDLTINGDIDGDGVGEVVLSGALFTTIFDGLVKVKAGAAATLENLTLKGEGDNDFTLTVGASGEDGQTGEYGGNGQSSGDSGGRGGEGTSGTNANDMVAGGLYNEGSLTLRDVSLVHLYARGGNGGNGGHGGDGGLGIGGSYQGPDMPELGGDWRPWRQRGKRRQRRQSRGRHL